jgi:hypothetical protein
VQRFPWKNVSFLDINIQEKILMYSGDPKIRHPKTRHPKSACLIGNIVFI